MPLTLPTPRAFADRPLAAKLRWLLAGCIALTACLAVLAVALIGWHGAERYAHNDARQISRLLAHALDAPVAFGDERGIQEGLDAVATRADVVGAWVWAADGRLIGQHGDLDPMRPGPPSGGLVRGHIDRSEAIVSGGGPEGPAQVVVRLDLGEKRDELLRQGLALLGAAVLGGLLSLWVSQRLARRLVQPMAQLADRAAEIAAGRQPGQRLAEAGSDEVGRAIRAFNRMIDEVGARGEALARANAELESRVAERTAQLEDEKARAEAASRAKTRFLANMSHELRTPLNGVIGAAQLLRDQGNDAHRRSELVEIIRGSGVNLLGLIDSVLDLARIESGTLRLEAADFNLADAVESAVATAAVVARQKGLHMACEIDPGLDAWRRGDASRLRQVLLNLLGNAVKFTLQGEVVLRVLRDAAPGAVRIEVIDSGIGMSESTRAQIFMPFRQAEDGSARRFGGTGLGLAICREVVQLMGGRIDVASQPERGSVFTVVLPLAAAEGRPAPPALGHRVAFIEPHEASARALQALLLRLGCVPIRCTDANELHAACRAGRNTWLLLDTDHAASVDIAEQCAQVVDPYRVIAMGRSESYSAERLRDRMLLSRSVTKPVLRTVLVSRFGAAAAAPEVGTRPPSQPGRIGPARAQRAARVLLVEDDLVNQTIVASMLTQGGLSVEVASDGRSALAMFSEMRFDVVLMDWQMPDMDGLEVTRRLRAGAAGARGRATPIIALTANAFAEDRAACLAAGMNDFLTKPVVAASLVQTVERWANEAAVVEAA